MKRQYIKPVMQELELNNKCAMLAGSPGVLGVSNSDGIDWKTDGFSDEEGDF